MRAFLEAIETGTDEGTVSTQRNRYQIDRSKIPTHQDGGTIVSYMSDHGKQENAADITKSADSQQIAD